MNNIGTPEKYLDAHKRGLITKFQLVGFLYDSVVASSPDDTMAMCDDDIRSELMLKVQEFENADPNKMITVGSYCGPEVTNDQLQARDRELKKEFIDAQRIWNAWLKEINENNE